MKGGESSAFLNAYSLLPSSGLVGPFPHTIVRSWASESSSDAGGLNLGGTGYGTVRARTYPHVPYRTTRNSIYAEENRAAPVRLWLQ